MKLWYIYKKKFYLVVETLKLLKLKINGCSCGVVWMKASSGSYFGLPKSTHTYKMCLNRANQPEGDNTLMRHYKLTSKKKKKKNRKKKLNSLIINK